MTHTAIVERRDAHHDAIPAGGFGDKGGEPGGGDAAEERTIRGHGYVTRTIEWTWLNARLTVATRLE